MQINRQLDILHEISRHEHRTHDERCKTSSDKRLNKKQKNLRNQQWIRRYTTSTIAVACNES